MNTNIYNNEKEKKIVETIILPAKDKIIQEKGISRKISLIEEDLENSIMNKSLSDTKERLKQNSILCNTPITKLLKANKNNH
jgi:hypothetical protein